MTWNYRVIVDSAGESEAYQIHEVFYNEDGQPTTWTKDPVNPMGDSLQELRDDYHHMRLALFKPILRIIKDTDDWYLGPEDTDQPTVDEFHRHEALDRTAIFAEHFETHVASHPVIQSDQFLKSQAEAIIELLCGLYQAVGRLKKESEQDAPSNR